MLILIEGKNIKTQTTFCFLALATLATGTGPACGQGTVIAKHSGATDPVSEGFTLFQAGSPSLMPVSNDMGRDAWAITLNSRPDMATYSLRLTPEQNAQAASGGWELSLTLRVAPPYYQPDGIFTALFINSEYYSLQFGAAPSGDPMLRLDPVHFTFYTLAGAGPGYHNYQLKHEAGAANASFWVDGTLFVDAVPGVVYPSAPELEWGTAQRGPPSENSNWSEVSLVVIPEPSCATLLGCGGLLLAAGYSRARREWVR